MAEQEINVSTAEKREKVYKTIDDLTLLDDNLMEHVFAQNIPATELLLRIILEDDSIKVISSKGQQELVGIVGNRKISLDILAVDGTGRYFDVEVQRNTEGTHVRRARFHSSMVDSHMLKENQKFKELLDSYVIFICEKDKFGEKLPIYHVDRVVRETKKLFDDGSHIVYVNGNYNGDDPIGKLVHDFRCKESKDMYYQELADGVKHFKETKEGRDIMCDAFEKLAEEVAEERIEKDRIQIFISMIEDGMTKEMAQKYAKITDEAVEKALEMMKATV